LVIYQESVFYNLNNMANNSAVLTTYLNNNWSAQILVDYRFHRVLLFAHGQRLCLFPNDPSLPAIT